MASVADCLVDILSRHEMLVIPDASEVVCRVFFLSLLLGNGGSQGIAQTLDESELHLVTGILDEIPVIIGFSSAFKNRMGQSVTDWMREENLNTPSR